MTSSLHSIHHPMTRDKKKWWIEGALSTLQFITNEWEESSSFHLMSSIDEQTQFITFDLLLLLLLFFFFFPSFGCCFSPSGITSIRSLDCLIIFDTNLSFYFYSIERWETSWDNIDSSTNDIPTSSISNYAFFWSYEFSKREHAQNDIPYRHFYF